MTETPNTPPIERGLIEDKAPKPPGVMSKHTQSLVIMGVAVLMVLIMWLTGNNKRPAAATNPTAFSPSVTATDTAKVQDLKQSIQTEQQATRRPIAPPDATQQGWLNAPGMYGNPAAPNQAGYYGLPGQEAVKISVTAQFYTVQVVEKSYRCHDLFRYFHSFSGHGPDTAFW